MSTKTKTDLASLPIVTTVKRDEVPAYGTDIITLPVGNGETVEIDRAFLSGIRQPKLRNIKQCLAIAGRDVKNPEHRKWFNKQVRDKWHKALKHANKAAMSTCTPVSMGVSIRDAATKTQPNRKVMSPRFSYEKVIGATHVDGGMIADKPKPKSNKSKSKGLVSLSAPLVEATKVASVKSDSATRESVPAVKTTVA